MDSLRTEFKIEYKCAICEESLSISSDKSKVSFNSAYNTTGYIYIHPCHKCKKKSDRLKENFKNMLESLKEGN